MNIGEVFASLLRSEEMFSAHLGRINALVLEPLLQAGSSENIKFFLLLNDHFQVIWHLTEENYRTLKRTDKSVGIQDVYLIHKADSFLNAYTQYFSSFSTCVVLQSFEQAARNKSCSNVWTLHKSALQVFLADYSPETGLTIGLYMVLQKPFRDHLQQYSGVLAKLKRATGQHRIEEGKISEASEKFAKLRSRVNQILDEACLTAALWKSVGTKFAEGLCTPERRLLEDSESLPICTSTGRMDRILLFNDTLVFIQGNNTQSFDLKLLWVDIPASETGNHALHIVTPEDHFFLLAKKPEARAVWQWKINRAVGQALVDKRDTPMCADVGEGFAPPLCRWATFVFRADGRFKGATYEGEWRLGKPHGKGKLTWPSGQNYAGDFKKGVENGFGICLIPQGFADRYDCYKCHWREGQMNGYGICEYGNETVYKGYFKDNLREGFGTLDSPPSKYTGHWRKDKMKGYGVWEDKERCERYIGMWENGRRHGPGIVVMQSGVCFQRTFQLDKMVGSGILLLEDGSVYEGHFRNDLNFVGKGRLTFPNGFVLEDTFTNKSREGLQMPELWKSAGNQQDIRKDVVQLGQEDFPVEKRWDGLYDQFLAFVHAGGQADTEESFMGFHTQTSRELRKSQESLFGHRGAEEASEKTDFLEELIRHQEPKALLSYLQQALDDSLHPLGKLLKALILVFQSTYSGIGANKHLLSMAQGEVKHYAKKTWEFYQDREGGCLILPLILPYFYPELLMLYLVAFQKQDEDYGQGILRLCGLPDTTLLGYLDVQKDFWPLKDPTLASNPTRPQVKGECFLSATECLQKMITTVDPQEKLNILQKTYEEIEKTINRLLGKEYNLPMDEFLPLLTYVVTRASIQHLGAEIHLIRDLMDPTNEGGMHDFLLTALESCYQLIQEIRPSPNGSTGV